MKKTTTSPTAFLHIGAQPESIQAAAAAILSVIKAAETEAIVVAAIHALAELARAPHGTSVSSCTFTSAANTDTSADKTKAKRKAKRKVKRKARS